MTPEEKASLEKIFTLDDVEQIQKTIQTMTEDFEIQSFQDLNYFAFYINDVDKAYRDIQTQKWRCLIDTNPNHDPTYTRGVIGFLELQKQIYVYQVALDRLKDTLIQNSLSKMADNHPKKKWLQDTYDLVETASQNLMKNTLIQGFNEIATQELNSYIIATSIKELETRLTLLAPQNFSDYAIDCLIINRLYKTFINRIYRTFVLHEPYRVAEAEKLAQDLHNLCAFENFKTHDLQQHFGSYVNDINKIVHTTLFPQDMDTILDDNRNLKNLKNNFVRKILQFEIPAFDDGVMTIMTKGPVKTYFRGKTTIYVHSSFMDGLPAEKQLVINNQANQVTKLDAQQSLSIQMPTPGSFFTILYDFGPNHESDFSKTSREGYSIVIYKSLPQFPINMNTYIYPITDEHCRLYLNQLAGHDFSNYTYCSYDPCPPDANLKYASSLNQLQPGTLLPLSQMAKGSSAFIAECAPTSTDRGLAIKRIIHLFDQHSYNK